MTNADRRTLRRGQILARQGDPADTLHLVESGLLKLLQLTPDGRQLIVRFAGPGEPFGGIAALDDAKYPVTALAVGPAVVLGWRRALLGNLLAAFPVVRNNLVREMADHMNDALTRVRELTTERVGQRLAHTLLRLARQCGVPDPDGVRIAHPLTRQELSELVGATLYTVSRTLSDWEGAGIIASTRRDLLVRDLRRLTMLTREDAEPIG